MDQGQEVTRKTTPSAEMCDIYARIVAYIIFIQKNGIYPGFQISTSSKKPICVGVYTLSNGMKWHTWTQHRAVGCLYSLLRIMHIHMTNIAKQQK